MKIVGNLNKGSAREIRLKPVKVLLKEKCNKYGQKRLIKQSQNGRIIAFLKARRSYNYEFSLRYFILIGKRKQF